MNPEPRTWLIGLDRIAAYMSWSRPKVYRQILKYAFPAHRASAMVPRGMAWQVSVQDINAWLQIQRDASWQHLAASRTGRRLMTRERTQSPAEDRSPGQPKPPPVIDKEPEKPIP